MYVIGVDGCRFGWIRVKLHSLGELGDACIASSIQEIWGKFNDASQILIDIPIGLKETGPQPRGCDAMARQILRRPRSSSVFPVPIRQAVYAETYEEGNAINRARAHVGMTKQAWNIIPKIQQVDKLLQQNNVARKVIRETHPEVCFWALAGGHPMQAYKKTAAGIAERLAILEKVYPPTRSILQNGQEYLNSQNFSLDDLIDALVCAVTAYLCISSPALLASIPRVPERDETLLPMEVVYYAGYIEGTNALTGDKPVRNIIPQKE